MRLRNNKVIFEARGKWIIKATMITAFLISSTSANLHAAMVVQRFPADWPKVIRPLRFARGRTTAVVKDVAKTPGIYEYRLKARAGQRMTIHITSSNKGVEFTLYGPRGSEDYGYPLGEKDWEGELGSTGEYQLILINNSTRGPKNPAYTLEVTIR